MLRRSKTEEKAEDDYFHFIFLKWLLKQTIIVDLEQTVVVLLCSNVVVLCHHKLGSKSNTEHILYDQCQ